MTSNILLLRDHFVEATVGQNKGLPRLANDLFPTRLDPKPEYLEYHRREVFGK